MSDENDQKETEEKKSPKELCLRCSAPVEHEGDMLCRKCEAEVH
ncbi:MAG: hypothetical protein AB1896_02410 [Thermodesulfobacteriota bacterium]